MKKLFLLLLPVLLVCSKFLFAQQWAGSSTINDLIYRNGKVLIGASSIVGSYDPSTPVLQVQGTTASVFGLRATSTSAMLDVFLGTTWLTFNAVNVPMNLSTNYVSRLHITTGGDIGIGTSTPASKFNVFEGDIRINATTANRSLILDAVSTVNLATMVSLRRSNSARWLFGASGNSGTDNFDFFRYSNTGSFLGSALRLERLTGNAIFENNVGVGTPLSSNPNNYRLAVNGKIGAKEVQVENTSSTWPDYVFESTYKLPDLSELDLYIKLNKHLPGIPSGQEIEKDGHKLGEMDVLLLKKIEEMTLYILQQEAKIKELESKINEILK